MEPTIAFDLLAEAYKYPDPRQLAILEAGLSRLPAGSHKQALASFVSKICCLQQGEWEELHTHTLDLDPPAAPYIGYQTWGESYQRGEFMSKMNRELVNWDIDLEGELPDHLIPALRYLGRSDQPLPELIEVINPAVQRMISALRSADPSNPYLDLFEAVQTLCKEIKKEAA